MIAFFMVFYGFDDQAFLNYTNITYWSN